MPFSETGTYPHTPFVFDFLKKYWDYIRRGRFVQKGMELRDIDIIRYGVTLGLASLLSIIAVAIGLPASTESVATWRITVAIVTGVIITICSAVCIAIRENVMAATRHAKHAHTIAAGAVLPIVLVLVMPLAAEDYMIALAIGLVVSGLGSLCITFAFQYYDETRQTQMITMVGGSDTTEDTQGEWQA